MAEDTLLKTLEEETRARVEDILKDAERRAVEIVEAAEKESSSLMNERRKELALYLEKERSTLVNGARVRSSGLLLEVRRSLIEEVLSSAVESFRRLSDSEYSGLLNRLYSILKKDWDSDGQESPLVKINPSDSGKIEDTGARFVMDPSVSLGVEFISSDGRVKKGLTIPSIVGKARKRLETDIDRIIFLTD